MLLGIVVNHVDAALVECSVTDAPLHCVLKSFKDLGGDGSNDLLREVLPLADDELEECRRVKEVLDNCHR